MEKIIRLEIWSWHPPVLEKRRKKREVYGGRQRETKRRYTGIKEWGGGICRRELEGEEVRRGRGGTRSEEKEDRL